jgi:hypothetical protein
MSFFWFLFTSCTFWILCNLLLLLTFCQVCLLVKETAEIETGMAEKSSWDQANIRQELGLVWRNKKKISQIIKDYFYLPFFLLIILWLGLIRNLPLTLQAQLRLMLLMWQRLSGFDVYGYKIVSGLYIGLTCNLWYWSLMRSFQLISYNDHSVSGGRWGRVRI